MFIDDLKNEFYNIVIGKRILVIVNYDIDAICASKILQTLFKNDHMVYSVVPVMGISGMQRAFNENKDDVKYVLFINCGGCIDILERLQPDDDTIFFVCDSHRPLDVCNIYSDGQIRIFGKPVTDNSIPNFESIFRDSDSEDESDSADDDNDDEQMTRVERIESKIQRRRERRKWEDERNRIMFEYCQFSFYGKSSAMTIFELAWKLSKDTLDLLWWAIVGVTEQLILGKIGSTTYTLEIAQIESHVSRLTNKVSDQSIQTAVKIIFENDLHLALYRHWSVQESLKHSMYSACKMRLWTLRGDKRLQELLVEMGLPIAQAKQTFSSMDLVLRTEFYSMIEKLAGKYDIPEIVYGSFTLKYGYRYKYSAADYVYGLLAILESINVDRLPEYCFLTAMDSLSRDQRFVLDGGIEKAKQLLSVIFKQVQSSLEMHQVQSAGPFLYYILNEENSYFCFPYGLLMLSKFILNGYVSTSRNRRARELPLIASCPIDLDQGLCLMIGIPPVQEDSLKNFFGRAFEQAAIKCNVTVSQDFFESSCIQIKHADMAKFLDALTVLLS